MYASIDAFGSLDELGNATRESDAIGFRGSQTLHRIVYQYFRQILAFIQNLSSWTDFIKTCNFLIFHFNVFNFAIDNGICHH